MIQYVYFNFSNRCVLITNHFAYAQLRAFNCKKFLNYTSCLLFGRQLFDYLSTKHMLSQQAIFTDSSINSNPKQYFITYYDTINLHYKLSENPYFTVDYYMKKNHKTIIKLLPNRPSTITNNFLELFAIYNLLVNVQQFNDAFYVYTDSVICLLWLTQNDYVYDSITRKIKQTIRTTQRSCYFVDGCSNPADYGKHKKKNKIMFSCCIII